MSDLAVTGATGRIGTLLRQAWSGAGSDEIAWLGRRDIPLTTALQGRRTLLALAGVTRGDPSALAANVDLALDALNAARDAGLTRVILVSSSAVYGRATGTLQERRRPTPVSAYGSAKARMEAAVANWSANHPDGPEVVCLRLGNIAGADALLGKLQGHPPQLDIFADGQSARRSYLGPLSLASIVSQLVAHPKRLPPVLNVAASSPVDMAALLRAAGCRWMDVPAAPEAIANVSLDTRLLGATVQMPQGCAAPDRIVAEWRALAA